MCSRAYVFTLNNPVEVAAWSTNTITMPECIRYCIFQVEQAPSSGRHHIQGYAELNKPMRVAGFKKAINSTNAHIEKRRGTRNQAREYCRKEDTRIAGPFEHGEWLPVGQGNRTDISEAVSILNEGGISKVAKEMPELYVKYGKGLQSLEFELLMEQAKKKFRDNLKVILIHGSTYTGKTRSAMEYGFATNQGWYKLDMSSSDSKVWWDGYRQEPILILDDFYGWIAFGKLMNICDVYPTRLDVKNSHTWANWELVIITSNRDSDEWYHNINANQAEALERRINFKIFTTPEDKCTVDKIKAILS